MIFSSPSWVPSMDQEAPDWLTVGDFVLGTKGAPGDKAPFVDPLSNQTYTIETLRLRVDHLARGLAEDLNWSPNEGSPWDKVVGVFSLNTIDYFVLCWAIHRLDGICMPLHATCTVEEIKSHMSKARCKVLFTCSGLISTCLEATHQLLVPTTRVYKVGLPDTYERATDLSLVDRLRTIDDLVKRGSQLIPLKLVKWKPGQGRSQIAFLCSTSGTSGRQKLAKLTHYGMITNVIQMTLFEGYANYGRGGIAAGALPFSHSYGLLIGHLTVWRGDCLIVLPRFDMQLMLSSVQRYLVDRLYLVPPILAILAANPFLFDHFNLSSISSVVTGAAAIDCSVIAKLQIQQPRWQFLHAWGLTETCIVATLTSSHDVWHGSSGSLLPGCCIRLVDTEGKEVESYDRAGEVLFKAPNVFSGYMGDEESTNQTFDVDGWLRTGDIGAIRRSPIGTEHLFIRDRIKDMIKVKGMQVLPADIESVLIKHPAIAEAAVVGVSDALAGERPMAFVVRSDLGGLLDDDLQDSIEALVESTLDETHWLNGRIRFVLTIPKSQSGKVLKRELKLSLGMN